MFFNILKILLVIFVAQPLLYADQEINRSFPMANHKITIYHDGTILTMDADFPQVEALAVMEGARCCRDSSTGTAIFAAAA